jgi:type III secretion protein L
MIQKGLASIVDEAEKVVKRTLNDAREEAKKIINEAKKEAETIIKNSKEAFEEERKKGHAKGLEEGKQAHADLMLEIASKKLQEYEKFESSIINIVMRSIRRILGDMNKDEVIAAVVRNSLSMIRNQKSVVVRVSPENAPRVREAIQPMGGSGENAVQYEVMADGRLGDDDCVIETETGAVNASLDVQLKAIEKTLQKHAS